jgi:hypothetical protein
MISHVNSEQKSIYRRSFLPPSSGYSPEDVLSLFCTGGGSKAVIFTAVMHKRNGFYQRIAVLNFSKKCYNQSCKPIGVSMDSEVEIDGQLTAFTRFPSDLSLIFYFTIICNESNVRMKIIYGLP